MKLAALIFGDEDRPKTAAGKSPEPGQIVRSIDGSVYRVASKIAGPDGVVVKLANLQGKPVQTPPNFRPVGLAVARLASWLRYHLAYNKDFDLYVNAYIEQYNNSHKDNPLPYPVGQDGKPFRWSNFFQKKISPKLFVRGHGNAEDQQALKDDIIHEMLFNTLGERHVLDQFVAKAKKLGVNRQNGATKLTDFLISTFMYRINEMQNKLNARSPEEEISMYQPGQTDEGEGEVNILETEGYGVSDAEFQSAEARKDVARFRESFRKWLGHSQGPKPSEAFILMFDIFWHLLQQNAGVDAEGNIEIKRNELQDKWMEKTGLSFGSFKDYFARLPEVMEEFILSHGSELGEKSIFVDLMNTIRAERTQRERKERRQQQKARPAMVSSLKIAEGIEEDVEEAQAASVSPMKVADGIGGDFAQAISNSENPDVVDPDIKQPTETVNEAAKEAAYKTASLVRGDALTPEMRRQVENAFVYRWTKENKSRTSVYHCDKCDVANNPFVGSNAEGHQHPTIPLQSDDEWLREHAFYFTNAGKLYPNRSAAPAFMAPEPTGEGLFASVAHRFAMEKTRKQAEGQLACCGGWHNMHKPNCSVKTTQDEKTIQMLKDLGKRGGISDRYMSPNQMVQEFTRPGGQGDRIRSGDVYQKEEPHITTKMRRGLGDPAIERKEGMLGHDFDNADGQAIRNETYPSTDYVSGEADTTEFRQPRMASNEIWECMDCGQRGELDPVGGGCATCGSQAIARVDLPRNTDVTPIREPNPLQVEKRMIPIREKMISPGGRRLRASEKTAQGSGNTTTTFQNQNVTTPNAPGKGQPMAVPDAIDQAPGPHSPNAPSTAPRSPGIQPRIVNVPPGTEGEESMGNVASKKGGLEELFEDVLSEYACPYCGSINIDVTPTETGYDVYCEDCERVTPSHGGATPGVSGLHATEPEFEDPDLEMEPEEPPYEQQHAGADKTAEALFEEHPLQDVTDLDVLIGMPQERKEEWLVAHGWTKDESHHGVSWWMQQPMWSKDGYEESIPYQETDNAIEKEVELMEEDIESKGIGCRQCGAVLNNAEGDLCPQCQAGGAEDQEDPFEHMGAEEGEDKMQVAKTILEQLGGNKFRAMTGAKNFVGSPNSLTFRLPDAGGFTKDGINAVQITLDPSDTYTVTFSRIRGGMPKVISMYRDIYVENLREVFERETGLATSLGKMGAGSNSGEDDPRGVGTNYNDEFYEHRTEGLSSEGMLSGMKEAAPVALNAPAPVTNAPNVQQNMNLVRPQMPAGAPAGTEVAITPSGGNQEETNVGKHTVEPELPNSKYHMMGSLIAAEERRLMAAAGLKQCKECGKIDPAVDEYEDGNYCTECASGQTKEAAGQDI
jgi:hypothetical protein